MDIEVALLPAQRHTLEGRVCIVVDLLRASSSIAAILSRGAREVVPAAGIEEARHLHKKHPAYLLCGEQGGLPPAGFDFGNSPSEFARSDLAGRSIILATSNGTRILAQAAAASSVLVGTLLNRAAVAMAARGLGAAITIIAAGAYEGQVFALEDAIGAGAIVQRLLELEPAASLNDGARAALACFEAARGDLPAAIAACAHARDLAEIGLAEDISYCARLDALPVAPLLARNEAGLPALRPFAA